MFSVDLYTREHDGHVVVELRGELDLVDAADVAAALATVAAHEPQIIVDLASLEFIDSSGVAALAHGRKQARRAGGDLLLAGPRPPVLRVLTVTRLVVAFALHASVEEAACSVGRSPRVAGPVPRRRAGRMHWARAARSATRPSARGPGPSRQQAGQAGG